MRVEDFRAEDTDAMVHMWRPSFEHGVGIIDPHPVEGQIEYFRKEVLPKNRVRLAKVDGEIVGLLAANQESVAQLFVRVANLRRGIGVFLLNLAKSESSGSLWLFTFARNIRACSFYESQGFTVVQRGFERFWQLEDVKYTWSRSSSAA